MAGCGLLRNRRAIRLCRDGVKKFKSSLIKEKKKPCDKNHSKCIARSERELQECLDDVCGGEACDRESDS